MNSLLIFIVVVLGLTALGFILRSLFNLLMTLMKALLNFALLFVVGGILYFMVFQNVEMPTTNQQTYQDTEQINVSKAEFASFSMIPDLTNILKKEETKEEKEKREKLEAAEKIIREKEELATVRNLFYKGIDDR